MSGWEPMLEQVVDERYSRLVAYAMLLTHAQADAEDLVQDALVATFRSRARFTTVAQAESYARRAIASRFVDGARRRGAERRAMERAGALAVPDVVAPPGAGLAPEVEAALARLSPQERACVVLRHMDDLSVRDTAQVLRLSEGAVKRYVADGIARMTAALGADVVERAPVVPSSPAGGRPTARGRDRHDA